MSMRTISLILAGFLIPIIGDSQSQTEKKVSRFYIGIIAGFNESKFVSSKIPDYPHFVSFEANYDKNSSNSAAFGFNLGTNRPRQFTIVPEMIVFKSKHRIFYDYYDNLTSRAIAYFRKAEYNVSNLYIRLSLIFNLSYKPTSIFNLQFGVFKDILKDNNFSGKVSESNYDFITKESSGSSLEDNNIKDRVSSGLGFLIG